MQQEEFHIGGLIKKMMHEEGRSVPWLASKIQCNRRNIYDIFSRSSMDTAQLLKISIALKINFFAYYSDIYEKKMNNKTEYVESNTLYLIPQGEIHIGSLIKKRFEEKERSVEWLAKNIGCQPRNIYDIFNNRTSMDTTQLLSISLTLSTNLFDYLSDIYKYTVSKQRTLKLRRQTENTHETICSVWF